ncbi:MAG: hypothetical protein ACRCX8_02840 [Sarcina sp.]
MVKCPKCKRELEYKYIKNNKKIDGIKCPSCRTKLEESKLTQIITLILAIIPMIGFSAWIENSMLKIVLIFAWAFLCNALIRPVIAKYSLKKD